MVSTNPGGRAVEPCATRRRPPLPRATEPPGEERCQQERALSILQRDTTGGRTDRPPALRSIAISDHFQAIKKSLPLVSIINHPYMHHLSQPLPTVIDHHGSIDQPEPRLVQRSQLSEPWPRGTGAWNFVGLLIAWVNYPLVN